MKKGHSGATEAEHYKILQLCSWLTPDYLCSVLTPDQVVRGWTPERASAQIRGGRHGQCWAQGGLGDSHSLQLSSASSFQRPRKNLRRQHSSVPALPYGSCTKDNSAQVGVFLRIHSPGRETSTCWACKLNLSRAKILRSLPRQGPATQRG